MVSRLGLTREISKASESQFALDHDYNDYKVRLARPTTAEWIRRLSTNVIEKHWNEALNNPPQAA